MKKGIILFVSAVTFPALEITTHGDKPVDESGIAFENGSPYGYRYDLNVHGKQGHVSGGPGRREVSL
jgi:hypothetical protein